MSEIVVSVARLQPDEIATAYEAAQEVDAVKNGGIIIVAH